jgi:hypothetical protein
MALLDGGEAAAGFGAGRFVRSLAFRTTGARTLIRPAKAAIDEIARDEKAEEYYERTRSRRDDVAQIAKHVGWREARVQRIKEHVFQKSHRLDDGVRRFDADPEIANAWDRMIAGDHVSSDIDLMKHEYFESRFESLFMSEYRVAHNAAIKSGRLWIVGK